MTERPILFSAPMVRANLEDRKTQTRRAVKPQPDARLCGGEFPTRLGEFVAEEHRGKFLWPTADGEFCGFSPYGAPGDFLWVRENFRLELGAGKPAASEGYRVHYEADGEPDPEREWGKQHPSIHLPRWACRLVLRVTDVRVERLNDCTEADALAEGVVWSDRWKAFVVPGIEHPNKDFPVLSRATAREMYAALWDTINGSGEWLSNPWVWVVSFERA